MKNIAGFFLLAKLFGLAPYSLEINSDQKPKRISSLISRIPTFTMIVFYSIFICSIFWKSRATSEISNTANWIQVKSRSWIVTWILKYFSQFIPNSLIFFIVLVTAESSRLTIQAVSGWIAELDLRLSFFHVSFARSNKRIKQLSLFALFRKSNVNQIRVIKILMKLRFTVVIFCGFNIAILHYIIEVDTSKSATIFYWLSFIIGKIGLLTFNFMFALYMTVLLERLRIVGKTLE